MADAARCDNRSEHADRPTAGFDRPWFPGTPGVLPEGWVRVYATDTDVPGVVSGEHGEVCSWDCAAGFMQRVALERAIDKAAADG